MCLLAFEEADAYLGSLKAGSTSHIVLLSRAVKVLFVFL